MSKQEMTIGGGQMVTVEVEARKSVRLSGIRTNTYKDRGQPFDLRFAVGERAVYGGYNMTYTGVIKAIGEKTVTIAEEFGPGARRLTLEQFAWRNWDYDAEAIAASNAAWTD